MRALEGRSKKKKDGASKLAVKGEVGEVSEMQLLLKKEVEEAPLS